MKRPIQRLLATAPLLFALTLLPATPTLADGPGFNCAKATRQIDKAICGWDTVAALDGRMASAYKATTAAQDGKATIASVKAGQRAWLAERDHRCALDKVTPNPGSEDGLTPQQYGQLLCLQTIYPPQIARLMDLAAAPLVPRDIKMVPIRPLQAAYPDDWQQAGYQAQFSPDKKLMALGVEDSAGYVEQVWLYQPTSGRLVVASPRTHQSPREKPKDISELRVWVWGKDGRFYVRARRPLGQDSVFGADMKGYAEQRTLPVDVAQQFATYDAAPMTVPQHSETPVESRPPGFDDDSYDEQEGGAFTVWAQNKGHGSFDLMAARLGDEAPRVIASGSWELRNFMFDPSGTRLFYNGEDGIVVTDPATGVTRRLKGSRGGSLETRPINMSADGEILVYSASGSCTRDATDEIAPDADVDSSTRVCLAYLAPVVTTASAAADTTITRPWLGHWAGSGEGALSATIKHSSTKPDELVLDLYTATQGCSGAVTLHGKPNGASLLAQGRDPDDASTPVCKVELTLDKKGTLKTQVAGPCTYYHGAACGFDGILTRSK